MPTPYWSRKATRRGARCECPADPAWSETLAYVDAPCTGTGRSRVRPGGGMPRRSVSGRRGAESDDERRREVRPGRSSGEAGEQGGAIRGGAGGAKGWGRGEGGPPKHAPDADPGSGDPGAGPHTGSSKAKGAGAVHCAAAPRQPGHAAAVVLRAQASGGPRHRWDDVAGLRGGSRGPARRSARTGPPRSVSAATLAPELYTEGGREAAAA